MLAAELHYSVNMLPWGLPLLHFCCFWSQCSSPCYIPVIYSQVDPVCVNWWFWFHLLSTIGSCPCALSHSLLLYVQCHFATRSLACTSELAGHVFLSGLRLGVTAIAIADWQTEQNASLSLPPDAQTGKCLTPAFLEQQTHCCRAVWETEVENEA